MSETLLQVQGTFVRGRKTASAGTAFVQGIPPSNGPGAGPPLIYSVMSGIPNWYNRGWITHITRLAYLTSTTAHLLAVLRPKNWTTFSAAVAKNVTSFPLTVDPGLYAANYKYPLPPGTVEGQVADNAIASGDYCAFQLVDGTWLFDKASGSYSAGAVSMTTGTPNITGATIAAGSPFFVFGTVADKDPATGDLDPNWTTSPPGSGTAHEVFSEPCSLISSLHPGDPMLAYSPNGTAAGEFELISGYFGKY